MKDIIREMVSDIFQSPLVGQVKVVDLKNFTCDVTTRNDGDVLDVRLRSIIDEQDTGYVLVPKISSTVIISPIINDNAQYYVAMFSEIDKIHMNVGGNILDIDETGFSMKNDQEDLKDILTSFCDEMLKIYAPKNVPGINDIKLRIKRLLK